jgi:hypothetical protein
MTFEKAAVRYFSTQVPGGQYQRIDGIDCFSPLSDYWFWRLRLNSLVRRGILRRRVFGSIWLSCRKMPSYGLAPAHASTPVTAQISDSPLPN